MSNKQPEALRLADWLSAFKSTIADEAAAELRRLAAVEVELERKSDAIQRLWKERDQLRADIHSCHPGCDRAGCVNERLRAEVEALRADAERLRHLEQIAHWEDERDMAPGGRWWAAVLVSNGRPTFRDAIDAERKG